MTRLLFISIFLYSLTLFSQKNIQEEIILNTGKEKEYHIAVHKSDVVEIEVKRLKGKKISELYFNKFGSNKNLIAEKRFKKLYRITSAETEGVYKLLLKNNTSASTSIAVKINIKTTHATPAILSYRTVYDTTYSKEAIAIEETIEKIAPKVLQKEKFYLNSRSNAYVKGGKDRIIFPVYLPTDTAEWFYILTASRVEEAVIQTAKTFSLASELTKYIGTNKNSLALAVTNLNTPPGADICDVYLMDKTAATNFREKKDFDFTTN